jgi:hypothetical protein
MRSNISQLNNWGQSNINFQSKGEEADGGSINGVRATLISNQR